MLIKCNTWIKIQEIMPCIGKDFSHLKCMWVHINSIFLMGPLQVNCKYKLSPRSWDLRENLTVSQLIKKILRFVLILSSHLRLGLPSRFIRLVSQIINTYAFLISPMRATRPHVCNFSKLHIHVYRIQSSIYFRYLSFCSWFKAAQFCVHMFLKQVGHYSAAS